MKHNKWLTLSAVALLSLSSPLSALAEEATTPAQPATSTEVAPAPETDSVRVVDVDRISLEKFELLADKDIFKDYNHPDPDGEWRVRYGYTNDMVVRFRPVEGKYIVDNPSYLESGKAPANTDLPVFTAKSLPSKQRDKTSRLRYDGTGGSEKETFRSFSVMSPTFKHHEDLVRFKETISEQLDFIFNLAKTKNDKVPYVYTTFGVPVFAEEDIVAYLKGAGVWNGTVFRSVVDPSKAVINYKHVLTVFLNEPALNEEEIREIKEKMEEIKVLGEQAAAASWGETVPNTPTNTPSTSPSSTKETTSSSASQPVSTESKKEDVTSLLSSTTHAIRVLFKGPDSTAIKGITTEKVTDSIKDIPADKIDLYDITPVDEAGNFRQISQEAVVTLPVSSGRKVSRVIYYLPETGAIENLAFEWDRVNNRVSFTVTHFSHYGVVYDEAEATTAATGKKALPKTNAIAQTGLYLFGLVLFVAGIAIARRKKKA